MKTFRKELEELINRYSIENCSNTPVILIWANYLNNCLNAGELLINERINYYKKEKTYGK